MTDAPERHSDRQAREASEVLAEIVEAGGVVNVRFDKTGGARLAIRFDTIGGPHAVRLFIAYRTARELRPDALRAAAIRMVRDELERPITVNTVE
ncbi:hypothetical protein GCM10007853_07940 [Algimonas ampicilliniresistens]|uniref:NIF system FeS cluster assembly NifU C-terminal domain-containing protein n=1 Tax=Algimonas ampicilliniresistens TaxID=1298735 RepID=A0ABQ5V6C0_9PROT|nr:hypothetical protein [Algimonas ampicilliniresistens]GLQ22920.1 hypothetical protein GCM10007853_07940 [Algimonas ampicilliniresistens]